MAIWLLFKDKYPISTMLAAAAHNGLLLVGTTFKKPGDINDNSLRFGFASLAKVEMELAVDTL